MPIALDVKWDSVKQTVNMEVKVFFFQALMQQQISERLLAFQDFFWVTLGVYVSEGGRG